MDQKIRKKQFVDAVVLNAFSENPIANKELATKLGITEQWYYQLMKRHQATIDEEVNKLRDQIRLKAFKSTF